MQQQEDRGMLNIEGRDEWEWIRALGDVRRRESMEGVEIAQGIGGATKVMSRLGMISFSFFLSFCYFLKDIQRVQPLVTSIQRLYGGCRVLQKLNAREEFQHMLPVFSLPSGHRQVDGSSAFRNPDVKGDRFRGRNFYVSTHARSGVTQLSNNILRRRQQAKCVGGGRF